MVPLLLCFLPPAIKVNYPDTLAKRRPKIMALGETKKEGA
jgi:hypothetical protein